MRLEAFWSRIVNIVDEIDRLGNTIYRAENLAGATDGPVPPTHRLLDEQTIEDCLGVIYRLYNNNNFRTLIYEAKLYEIIGCDKEEDRWYWYNSGERIF